MRISLAFAAILAAVAPAGAQPAPPDKATPPASPDEETTSGPVTMPGEVAGPREVTRATSSSLGVELRDPEHLLSLDAVRAAIGVDLAVRIVDATAFAPSLGRLEIAIEVGTVRIAYHPAAGTVIERTLALPQSDADRLELIAFVATNLVRDQATEVIDGLPVIPPPAAPPKAPAKDPTKWIPATLGLVPPLSVDEAFGAHVSVGFGLHVLVGKSDETTIASISGVADIVDGNMHGAQIGGAATFTRGDVNGAQIAGAATIARGKVHGAQIAGAVAIGERVEGAQIAGAATSAESIRGAQIAGAVAIAKRVDGAQIAGGVAIAGDVDGVQIAPINIARRTRGVQIGVINLSDDGDDSYPIGVINYSRTGGVAFDGWVDSSRVSAVGFRHGTKHVHNLWSVGWSPDHDNPLVGAGLGITFHPGELALDIDAMHWLTDVWDGQFNQIDQLRASVTLPLARNLEVFGGVAANVYISDVMEDNSGDFHPTSARRLSPTDSTTIVMWPSAFAGVRVRAR